MTLLFYAPLVFLNESSAKFSWNFPASVLQSLFSECFLGKNKVDEPDKVSRTTKAEISDSDVFEFRPLHQHISVTTSSEYGSLSTAATDQHRYGDIIVYMYVYDYILV